MFNWNYDNYINTLENNWMKKKQQQKAKKIYTVYNELKSSKVTPSRNR